MRAEEAMKTGSFVAVFAYALLLPMFPLQAQENGGSTQWSGSWTTGIYSQYFGANGAVFAEEPVVQSELDIVWTRGKTSGMFILWGSKGFKDTWKTFSDEVDVGASVSYAGALNVSATFLHLLLVPDAVSDVQTVGFSISKTLPLGNGHAITPSLNADFFWPTGDGGPQSGKLLAIGISHSGPLASRINMSHKLQFVRDPDGAFGFRPKTNTFRYHGGVDLNVGNGWTLSPKAIYGGAFNDRLARPAKLTFALLATRNFSM